LALVALVACAPADDDGPIQPGPDAQRQALEAFIGAQDGDVIEFAAGRFSFDTTLSIDASGVTVRGAGMDETILDFSDQAAGSGGEGILVTADDFTVEDLAVFNSRSDGIKIEGTAGASFRRVFVNWEGDPSTENGAYGLYPVQVDGVLIEDSKVRGSSDAGIYVGQSNRVVVRRNETWENVAGIEIENSSNADVYDNYSHHNTGGVLVFSLPELPVKNGRDIRVWNNRVVDNNHPNFGKPGAIVSEIPAGSGLILMASDNIDVFGNEFRNNETANVSIISYLATGREYNDGEYDPYSEGISIRDNSFAGGGSQPAGSLAELAMPLIGTPLPDIVFDGVVDASKKVDGSLPEGLGIYVAGNGDADFVNLDLGAALAGGEPQIDRDLTHYAGVLPEPPGEVLLDGSSR
jgi:parallel beta-helix repeat protein